VHKALALLPAYLPEGRTSQNPVNRKFTPA
jgi:hypothetical protein